MHYRLTEQFEDKYNVNYCALCDYVVKLKKEMKIFTDYYNNHRYQWDLKKMTPIEYRNHLLVS